MDPFFNEFDKKLNSYLTVYKTPIASDQLDPTVFYFPENGERPRLQPGVHAQITNDIEMLASGQPARIVKYVIVGKVVEPGNNDKTCDIKVLVVINKNIMDFDVDGLVAEDLLKLANTLSRKLAVGTLHKIRYIIMIKDPTQEPQSKKYPAIYNVPTFSWIKYPSGLKAQ
jgi:hypothetical protein